MPWKTWIQIEPHDTANETVQRLYDRTRDKTSGHPPDVVSLNSLTPDVAALVYYLNRAIHDSAKGLTPREQEIAALVVSSLNG